MESDRKDLLMRSIFNIKNNGLADPRQISQLFSRQATTFSMKQNNFAEFISRYNGK